MPTYHVDFTSDRGDQQRVRFTLDDDRPLGPQLRHVLEELRARGMVLRGGPEDELAVTWNGRALEGARTLQQAGATAMYPLVLAMRRRAAPVPTRPEPAATPFLPRGAYLGVLSGLTGAAFAWIVTAHGLADLSPALGSYGALDLATASVFGAFVGGLVVGIEDRGAAQSFPVGVTTGALAGAAGAAAGCLLGGLLGGPLGMSLSSQGFRLTRLVTWALMSGVLGFALGVLRVALDRRRMLDGLLLGLGAGVVGGGLMLLPGPTDLWQMLGFLLVGGVIGFALVALPVQRAVGIVELDTVGGRAAGLLSHRWWPVRDGVATSIARRFVVESRGAACRVTGASEAVTVAGDAVNGAAPLLNQDEIVAADLRFRFRRLPGRGL